MDPPHHKVDEKTVHLPPYGEPVWVRCEGFRCLAVRDHHGQWRTFFNNEPLTGEIQVIDDKKKWKKAGE
jgi:hypothetical protein